jgi:monovalent cation:H+ antiporter-2, CPA2 family
MIDHTRQATRFRVGKGWLPVEFPSLDGLRLAYRFAMATGLDLAAYKDTLIVLTTAAVLVPLASRLKISPVITFIVAGILLGPTTLASLTGTLPFIANITISSPDAVAAVAEIGIVFLLFLIALELSFERLSIMRRAVFGMGSLQLLLCGIVMAGLLRLYGLSAPVSLIIGLAISLSSTAIIIEMLARQKRLATGAGRASFSILLLQDLALVPLLLLVGVLTQTRGDGMDWTGMLTTLAIGIVAVTLIVIGGRLLLRPLFRLVVSTGSPDLFIAAAIFVALGTGVATAAAGLSMALGAFISGLLLAETEYRKAIEAVIEPFKTLLLGVFFFSVGMKIDLTVVAGSPVTIIVAIAIMILVKAILVAPLIRLFGFSNWSALHAALLLAPAGEFAFVIIGLGNAAGLIDGQLAALTFTVIALSMALLPAMDALGKRISARLRPATPLPPEATLNPPDDVKSRALVVGGGRVGQLVSDMLGRHDVPHFLIERDPDLVARLRRLGKEAYFGDAANASFLQRCGIMDAAALIITTDTNSDIESIVGTARAARSDIAIISRARDANHATKLYGLGVTDAVPETVEASLQLSEATLMGLGIAAGRVIASIHEQRDVYRSELKGRGLKKIS